MASSLDVVNIAVTIPSLGLTKKFTFRPSDLISYMIQYVSQDLGLPVIESFGVLSSSSGRWCDNHATLFDCGFTASADPTLRHACELKIRKSTEVDDASGSVKILPCIPSDPSTQYLLVCLSASQPPEKSVVIQVSKGTTVGMVLVLLKSDSLTRPPGSQDDVDTFGLQVKILDKSNGSHRLTLNLAESTVFGENAFDGKLPLSFCPVKVLVHVEAFFDMTDFHSPPAEISLSLDSLSIVSFSLQKLIMFSSQPSSALSSIELMLYFPNKPLFKNCGLILNPSSVLTTYGYILSLRAATRSRLEGTVGMTANTVWVSLLCPSSNPPLKADALLDTNISFTDVLDLFWTAHSGRASDQEYGIWSTPLSKKGSGSSSKSTKVPKFKKVADHTLRLRELGVQSGTIFEFKPIGKPRPVSMSPLSSSLGPSSSPLAHSSILSPSSEHAVAKLLAVKAGPLLRDNYGIFGLELQTIPLSSFQLPKSLRTVQVPSLLISVREALTHVSGLSVDGIFRQGGTESLIKTVADKLLNQTFDPHDYQPKDRIEYIHSLASLLKRWLGALPSPLLGSLKLNDFQSSNPSAIIEGMPQPFQDLSHWLLAFLAETASYSRFNRMDASNLAIVFAPLVMKFPEDDIKIGVELTKATTIFLQRLIEEKSDPTAVPVVPSAYLPPPPPPIAGSSSATTPRSIPPPALSLPPLI